MKRRILRALRMLLVFPLALGIPALQISFPQWSIGEMLGSASADFRHALNPFLTSMFSVFAGYFVAPGYKFRVALGVSVIWLLVLLTALCIVWFGVKVEGNEQAVLDGGMAMIATLISLMIALLVCWRLRSKFNKGNTIGPEYSFSREELPEPWFWTDVDFSDQLRIELSPGHVLFGRKVKSIAKREDKDEVLFSLLDGGDFGYAVVHLTWSKVKQDGVFPMTEQYHDWEEVYQKRILVDAELNEIGRAHV